MELTFSFHQGRMARHVFHFWLYGTPWQHMRLIHLEVQARLEESRTTIYQKEATVTYQLKMKTSRAVFSEVQKKAGAFPFNIRCLEDEKRARLGLQEAVQHSLVKPYEVM